MVDWLELELVCSPARLELGMRVRGRGGEEEEEETELAQLPGPSNLLKAIIWE